MIRVYEQRVKELTFDDLTLDTKIFLYLTKVVGETDENNWLSNRLGNKTFRDMCDAWRTTGDSNFMYREYWCNDSEIRGKCFTALSKITGEDYDYFYNTWLNNECLVLEQSCKYNKHLNRINESRNVEVYTFDELTDAQQEEIVEKISNGSSSLCELLYNIFDDVLMEDLEVYEQVEADKFESRCGLSIHTDKLYWQSNSQGPYPEWDLSKVFDDISLDRCNIEFYGKGTNVCASIELYDKNDEYIGDYDSTDNDDLQNLRDTDKAVYDKAITYIKAAQDYIDCVWEKVKDVYTSYPDNDWIKDLLSANECEFIIENGNVRPY